MATFVREYHLTINQCVAIDAKDEAEAARIFSELEHNDRTWWYLKNEVFDHMGEYLGNNERDVVMDIKPYMGVIHDENYAMDVIDHTDYIEE